LHILTVSHFYESHGGGIERVAGHLCRQFADLGIDASWAASDADALPAGENGADAGYALVPLRCINPTEKLTGLPMPIPGIRAMVALAKQIRRADAVIIHDALYVTSIMAMIMAKLLRKRTVLIQHISEIAFSSPIPRKVMALANELVTRPMLASADARVFISDTARHDLIGTPPRRAATLLFNGVDRTIFHPGSSASPTEHQPRRILFVGRYVEKKGLAIIQTLAAARPDLQFLLAGSGPIRPGDWQLANVTDLGRQSPQALARLYREADMLLLPSVGEGYPLVIQEAMACGLPVICGAPSDRADPGAAAWLRGVAIDLADPAGSAERCSAAIDTHSLSATDRAEMARYAANRYSWGAMATGLVELARGDNLAAVRLGTA